MRSRRATGIASPSSRAQRHNCARAPDRRETSMYKVVLLRHGESQWNKENRFTGWADVGLTEQGMQEAKRAATLLRDAGFSFDIAFTSMLKRAIKTLWTV